MGQDVFDALSAAAGRGVAVRIVQTQPSDSFPDDDSAALAKLHPSTVILRSINMTAVLGGGIIHTKFLIVDGSSIFVGSANMDWRCFSRRFLLFL
jgi:phospholipase D3/4